MTSVKVGFANELKVKSSDIQHFFLNNWERDIALTHNKFYNWQFLDTPSNTADQCCVAIHEHQLVAVMGLNERSFYTDGKSIKAAELTTWIVKRDKRSLGLGNLMIDFLQSQFSALFAMGISSTALPIYLFKDFKYIKSVPRFLYVLNYKTLKKHGRSTQTTKILSRKPSQKHEYKCIAITPFTLDSIFESFSNNYDLYSRNFDWIRWRYFEHPSFTYSVNIIDNKEGSICVVVYRIDSLEEFSIMHCTDLYGDELAFPSALTFIEDRAKEKKVDIIDFYSTCSSVNSHFINRNWLPLLDYDFVDFPHLFHPIEMRTPSTTSLVMWCKEQKNSFFDLTRLYITKQDCDFDRPVKTNV